MGHRWIMFKQVQLRVIHIVGIVLGGMALGALGLSIIQQLGG